MGEVEGEKLNRFALGVDADGKWAFVGGPATDIEHREVIARSLGKPERESVGKECCVVLPRDEGFVFLDGLDWVWVQDFPTHGHSLADEGLKEFILPRILLTQRTTQVEEMESFRDTFDGLGHANHGVLTESARRGSNSHRALIWRYTGYKPAVLSITPRAVAFIS